MGGHALKNRYSVNGPYFRSTVRMTANASAGDPMNFVSRMRTDRPALFSTGGAVKARGMGILEACGHERNMSRSGCAL
jgi:hypothetical protein